MQSCLGSIIDKMSPPNLDQDTPHGMTYLAYMKEGEIYTLTWRLSFSSLREKSSVYVDVKIKMRLSFCLRFFLSIKGTV